MSFISQVMYSSLPKEKLTTLSRMESIQIPDSLLKKIPTESLLDSCLCYPYFIIFLFYNSFEEGLLALKKTTMVLGNCENEII